MIDINNMIRLRGSLCCIWLVACCTIVAQGQNIHTVTCCQQVFNRDGQSFRLFGVCGTNDPAPFKLVIEETVASSNDQVQVHTLLSENPNHITQYIGCDLWMSSTAKTISLMQIIRSQGGVLSPWLSFYTLDTKPPALKPFGKSHPIQAEWPTKVLTILEAKIEQRVQTGDLTIAVSDVRNVSDVKLRGTGADSFVVEGEMKHKWRFSLPVILDESKGLVTVGTVTFTPD